MNLQSSDFELFGVPECFTQDIQVLTGRWKQLQREAHPDRFAAQGDAARRHAMQWSVRINEAWQRLKDPIKRAAYLCERHGAPVNAENNTAMPSDFLMQQMEWREALDDADGRNALDALTNAVTAARRDALAALAVQIDDRRDFLAAVGQVRALMFIERFADEVENRMDAWQDAVDVSDSRQ